MPGDAEHACSQVSDLIGQGSLADPGANQSSLAHLIEELCGHVLRLQEPGNACRLPLSRAVHGD
jgi:hypothetical protein